MLDLNNRKYKSIEFFVSGELVCFEMENGLSYSVLLQKKEIIVCVNADGVLKYLDSVEPGNQISKEELDKAVAILKTAPLPTYRNDKLKSLEKTVHKKLLEEKLDLKDRRYRNVVAYEPDNWACFEMENGLVYIVLLRIKKIAVRVYARSFIES